MNLLDHHMHSRISFDSKADLESYLKLSNNPIITTEHLDFKDPSDGYVDRIPNYIEHRSWAKELNKDYDNRVFVGLEIGWTKESEDSILEFIQDKTYDLVLLSVHQNGHADYLEKDKFVNLDKVHLIKEYLGDLKDALNSMKDHADVFAHFDYGFRVHDIQVEDLQTHGYDLLNDIFKIIIEHNIAFELNTSSMYKHKNLDLYAWAIPIYQSLGGDRFVLGSDAHSHYEYQRNFKDAIEFIKGFGVNKLIQLYSDQADFISI